MESRLNFGVYLASVEEACQSGIWHGISQFASQRDINLTVFISTYQQRVGSHKSHYEVTRDFATSSNDLDGIIFLGGPISDGIGKENARSYFDMFSHLPSVNISMDYGETSLLVDNHLGIFQVVDHFIKVHSKKRIAFARGPVGHPEADARYEAYCEALKANHIDLDLSLVVGDQFSEQSGRNAVHTLLTNDIDFDSVVSVDDETALGVISELRNNGISVPKDITVSGFDNIEGAEANAPSLTTIVQPFNEIGFLGAEQLYEKCCFNTSHTSTSHSSTILKPELIIRQSCGCIPEHRTTETDFQYSNIIEIRDSLAEIIATVNVPIEIAKEWFQSMGEYLLDISTGEHSFLTRFDQILTEFRGYSTDLEIWHEALSEFQIAMVQLNVNDFKAQMHVSSLILRSSWLIHEAKQSEHKKLEIENNRTQWKIRGIAQDIMTAFDYSELYEKVEIGFKELGINRAMIGLYNRPVHYKHGWKTPEELRLMMAFEDSNRLIKPGEYKKITISELLETEKNIFSDRKRTSLFMPLFFGDEQLGVLLLEENTTMPVDMYETLRLALSTVLKGASLFAEVKELAIKDELSGLYNRRGFLTLAEARLKNLQRRHESGALLFIDLDGLKRINDIHGHNEGDNAIIETARILSQVTRQGDILARLGGDEFILLVADLGAGEIQEIIERVRTTFDHFNNEVSTFKFELSCSIGAEVTSVTDNISLEDLMARADSKLYEEKARKKQK